MDYVYIISEGENGPVKIGRSKAPATRLDELQIGNSRPLKLARTWETHRASRVERHIHKCMWPTTVHAVGEWFNISEDDAFEVVELALKDCKAWAVPE